MRQSLCLFFLFVILLAGCQEQQSNQSDDNSEIEEEFVTFHVVDENKTPLSDAEISLGRIGDGEYGIILKPTDKNGKTTATLIVGEKYEASIRSNRKIKNPGFTISANKEDNEITLVVN
ncbi:DUF2606 family protein [Lentibacillus sediminis]|uniref:DUF2606 family protein n=1 Tax=Lentibacillus sediminis TaxID=1940529 RepID=UPI000C1BC536|nr:DUF2606 family protein [Lentibacillus sediminis]